jgi:hypothetical protein
MYFGKKVYKPLEEMGFGNNNVFVSESMSPRIFTFIPLRREYTRSVNSPVESCLDHTHYTNVREVADALSKDRIKRRHLKMYLLITLRTEYTAKAKAVPLHAMKALGGRGGIAPTHSRPRH